MVAEQAQAEWEAHAHGHGGQANEGDHDQAAHQQALGDGRFDEWAGHQINRRQQSHDGCRNRPCPAGFPADADPVGQETARAGGENHREQQHRHRVHGMAEVDRKALHQRNLHEHEASADAGEIEQPAVKGAVGHLRFAGDEQRRDDHEQNPRQRKPAQQHQGVGRQQVAAGDDAEVFEFAAGVEERGRLQDVEEIGPAVGRRGEVQVFVFGGGEQAPFASGGEQVADERLAGLLPRRVQDVEAVFPRHRLDGVDVRLRQRFGRYDQRRHGKPRNQGDMVGGPLDPPAQQRHRGERNQPVGFRKRLRRVPARNAEQAIRIQMIEENLPAFDGVQAILREGEGAGAGPGVDQRHLDHIVAFLRAREVGPRLVVDEPDLPLVRELRELAAVPGQHLQRRRVDFDSGDARAFRPERREDVPAAADPDHRRVAPWPQVVGQRGDVETRPVEIASVPVPLGDGGAGLAVDQHGLPPQPLDHRRALARPPEKRPGLQVWKHQHLAVYGPKLEHVPLVGDGVALGVENPEALRAGMVGERPGEQRRGNRDPRQRSRALPGELEQARAEHRDGGGGEGGAGDVEGVEQQQAKHAAQSRPDQIHAIDQAAVAFHLGQGDGHHHPAEKEWHRHRQGDQRHPRHAEKRPAIADVERGVDDHKMADDGTRSEQNRVQEQIVESAVKVEPARPQINPKRARGHAEHRHRHREKRKVVPGHHRQQPSVQHLQHERCAGDGEQAQQERPVGGGCGWHHHGGKANTVRLNEA